MNRSFFVVLIPPVLVAIGYIIVLRRMGLSPQYGRLAVALAAFFLALWIVRRKMSAKAKTGGR